MSFITIFALFLVLSFVILLLMLRFSAVSLAYFAEASVATYKWATEKGYSSIAAYARAFYSKAWELHDKWHFAPELEECPDTVVSATEESAPVEPVVSATEAPEETVETPRSVVEPADTVVSATEESAPVEPVVSATEAPEETVAMFPTQLAEAVLKTAKEGRHMTDNARSWLAFAYEHDIQNFRRLLNDSECDFIDVIVEERKLSRAQRNALKSLLNTK